MPQHIELIYLLSVSAVFEIQFGFGVTKSKLISFLIAVRKLL